MRAVEIKLSQGAKPGLGGLLPAPEVTEEMARIRGVPVHRDCASPSAHTAFTDVESLIEFVERIADATGLPVGVKSAVGDLRFWDELAERMAATGAGPDFITIDGSEGGTGAAPLAFSDHVAMPFKLAFASVYARFAAPGPRRTSCSSARAGSASPTRRCTRSPWASTWSHRGHQLRLRDRVAAQRLRLRGRVAPAFRGSPRPDGSADRRPDAEPAAWTRGR